MTEMAILNDVTSCMGCRGCQVACKQWNELPAEKTSFAQTGSYQNPPDLTATTWNILQFTEWNNDNEVNWAFSRRACMHCTDAACIDICPVEAISKTAEGFVAIDKDDCVACGMCEEACPFQVPKTGEIAGKCNLCLDRIKNDLQPACVKTCSAGALKYGPREDLLAEAREISAKHPDWQIYGEEQLEGLHVIYVLPDESDRFQLAKSPQPGNLVYLLKAIKFCLPGSLACSLGSMLVGKGGKKKENQA